jgi:hypothetical protein
MPLELRLLQQQFAVCRLGPAEDVPGWASAPGALTVLARTEGELSIVCDDRVVPDGVRAERGFRTLMVCGPLPFDAVGILAAITAALSAAAIPLLAISTFDTDYVLVRDERVEAAIAALRAAGCGVSPQHAPRAS